MVSSAKLCLMCKGGKNLCGWRRCPLLAKIDVKPDIEKIGQDFFGPSTSIFIGRQGYPNVFVGPVASLTKDNLSNIDSPNNWFGQDYSKLIEMRSLILRSKKKESIFSKSRFVAENQELSLASKPTDVEIKFKKKPVYRFSFSDVSQPMGVSASVEKFRITENTKIPQKTEKIVSDDLKAHEASFLLYSKGEDVYKISTILSSGLLGLENKKMVPTRWSITALDDIVGKQLIQKIKDFSKVSDYLVFESQYLDNHFVILLMPGEWEFENFESWAPGSTWSQGAKETYTIEEYEPYKGRKKYADKQAGGYYAARLGILEGLAKLKKQARVVSFREISEGYMLPMGVWVVRETVRNAFKNSAQKFSTLAEALDYINSKLKIPVENYKKQSVVLGRKTIGDFV